MIFFALNHHRNTVTVLRFTCWEQVLGAFRCGIMMPDSQLATGIGREKSMAAFKRKAAHGKTTILAEL